MAVVVAVAVGTVRDARAAAGTARHAGAVGSSAASAAAAPRAAPADPPVTISLREQNGSGVGGTATLAPAGTRTLVALAVTGAAGGLPAHLHRGRCGALEAPPAYPLTDAHPGAATTTIVAAPLGELLGGGYAIAVHRRAEDLAGLLDPAGVVACGELGDPNGGAPAGGEVSAMPGSGMGAALPPPPEPGDGDGGLERWLLVGATVAIALIVGLGAGVLIGRARGGRRAPGDHPLPAFRLELWRNGEATALGFVGDPAGDPSFAAHLARLRCTGTRGALVLIEPVSDAIVALSPVQPEDPPSRWSLSSRYGATLRKPTHEKRTPTPE